MTIDDATWQKLNNPSKFEARILAHDTKFNMFREVEDIDNIKGI